MKQLNSSNLSSSSFVFGKTAAEALCERNAKKGIVDYSITDEMISVDTFQMGKRGTVTGTQVHEMSSSDVVPDSTQVHQDKSSDAVSDTSSTPLFKEDTGSISLDDSSTKPNVTPDEIKSSPNDDTHTDADVTAEGIQTESDVTPDETKSSPDDDTHTDADVTAEGIQTEPDVTPDETKSPADEDTNPKPDVTPDGNESPADEDTNPKPDVTPVENKSPADEDINPKPDVTPNENKSPPNDDKKPKPDVTPDENKSPPNDDKKPKPKRNMPKCRLDNFDKGMSKTGVVGGTGSVGDSCTGDIGDNPDKVTITVHSNIDSLVKNISDKFEDYVSKLGRKVNIKLSSTLVVKMTNVTPADPIQKKKITKLAVTASVCGSDKKSLNIYVDEDLKLEEQIVAHHLQPAPTKGKQMSEYYFTIIRLFILFFISETLACQCKLVLLVEL